MYRKMIMKERSEPNILDYIIEITEQRDAELLEMSLAKTLFELYDAEKVLFCSTRNGNLEFYSVFQVIAEGEMHDLSFDEIDSLKNELEALFSTSVLTGSCVEEKNAAHHVIVHPVHLFSHIVGFIVVYPSHETSIDNAVIEGFLKIYQNYITLLHDNQRDRLTGLLNRKTFDDRIMKIIELKKTREKTVEPENTRRHEMDETCGFWLGIADIDNFKTINDTFGHVYGDEVLILVSRLMTQSFRSDDLLFRYGGEEFVVIIRASDEHSAFHAFDRFRERVASYNFPRVGSISVSIGMVQITSQEVPTSFVGHADQALYYGKTHGKNRVCSYEKLVGEGLLKSSVQFGKVELF